MRLISLPVHHDDDPGFLEVDSRGQVLARGFLRAGEPTLTDFGGDVLIVPGNAVLIRWLDIPARTELQARAAAELMIREDMAQGQETAHVALAPKGDNHRRLVVVVDRAHMQAWLGLARQYGVDPAVVIPDCLLFAEPEPAPDGQIVARAIPVGDLVAIRGREFALTCEPELLEPLMGTRPWAWVDPGEPTALMAIQGAITPQINLRQGEFAVRTKAVNRSGEISRLTRWIMIAAACLFAQPVVSALLATRQAMAIEQANAKVSASLFPGVPATTRQSADYIRQTLANVRGGSSGASVLIAQLYEALEKTPAVELRSLNYARGEGLTAKIGYANPQDLQVLRNARSAYGTIWEFEESQAASDHWISVVRLRGQPSRDRP